MRYSLSGKPLCCSCRRVATHRTSYRSKNDTGTYEARYIYQCQLHAHRQLSESLPQREALEVPVVALNDAVHYRGWLYRVVGIGRLQPHIMRLWLHRIGVQNKVRDISICVSPYEPYVSVVKPFC